jgi:hypothetical protein
VKKKHKTEEKKEMSEDEGLTMYFLPPELNKPKN